MNRQILIGIVKVGKTPTNIEQISDDQLQGLLKHKFIEYLNNDEYVIILTSKGCKIYEALEAVIASHSNY